MVLVVRLYHPLKSIISLMFLRLVWCFRLLVNYLRQVVVLSASYYPCQIVVSLDTSYAVCVVIFMFQ